MLVACLFPAPTCAEMLVPPCRERELKRRQAAVEEREREAASGWQRREAELAGREQALLAERQALEEAAAEFEVGVRWVGAGGLPGWWVHGRMGMRMCRWVRGHVIAGPG